jgi:hypothetical protein
VLDRRQGVRDVERFAFECEPSTIHPQELQMVGAIWKWGELRGMREHACIALGACAGFPLARIEIGGDDELHAIREPVGERLVTGADAQHARVCG